MCIHDIYSPFNCYNNNHYKDIYWSHLNPIYNPYKSPFNWIGCHPLITFPQAIRACEEKWRSRPQVTGRWLNPQQVDEFSGPLIKPRHNGTCVATVAVRLNSRWYIFFNGFFNNQMFVGKYVWSSSLVNIYHMFSHSMVLLVIFKNLEYPPWNLPRKETCLQNYLLEGCASSLEGIRWGVGLPYVFFTFFLEREEGSVRFPCANVNPCPSFH